MGCYQSKNKHNDVFLQCKERHKFMEKAIASWEAFSTTYSAYSMALKNVGAALSDYSQGIIEEISHYSLEKSSSISHVKSVPSNAFPVSDIPTSPLFMCTPIIENEEEMNGDEAESTPLINGSDRVVHSQINIEISNVRVMAEIMNELDQHFLEGSESARQVLEILETPHIGYNMRTDYAAQVMKAISWSRSLKGVSDECEIHAGILEWEERLYGEVKEFELVKFEHKKNAATSHFHIKCNVFRESVQSTILEIKHLRDEVLYQKLVSLADRMARMWVSLHGHHKSQLTLVSSRLRDAFHDSFLTPIVTSQQHYERTALLFQSLKDWKSQFHKLVIHQKEYIEAINGWSGLTHQENSSLPQIQNLLETWKDEIEKLHYELGISAIDEFSDVISTIRVHQENEITMRKKCEEIYKDCMRKEPLKRKMEEQESFLKICEIIREKSVMSLTVHLEALLRTMSEFALASSEMYNKLIK